MLLNIEQLYQDFYRNNISTSHNIDFIGVNISSDMKKPVLFKTYQHIGTSIDQFDPFLSLVDQKNMIKNYIPIKTSDNHRVQYDVRLDNRFNGNMKELFSFLTDYLTTSNQFSDLSLSELLYFSKMSITSLSGYDMSSLYFLGLQWNKGALSALKSHFLTRKVNNPDHFSDGFWYDDRYFLSYINECHNSLCQKISYVAEKFLNQVEGHLWMFGIDISMESDKKYKIYLQNKNGFNTEELLHILREYNEFEIVCQGLDGLCSWLKVHTELFLYGFAITVATNGTYGFNLYFIPPDPLRGTP